MIPKDITRDIILEALREIDENGTPSNRLSMKYTLSHGGNLYSPKYVISIANRIKHGTELKHYEFGGGEESNAFLRSLGFEIRGEQSSDYSQDTRLVVVSTAVVYSTEIVKVSNTDRKRLLTQIIKADTNTDIILLPAGFYQRRQKADETQVSSLEKE